MIFQCYDDDDGDDDDNDDHYYYCFIHIIATLTGAAGERAHSRGAIMVTCTPGQACQSDPAGVCS